MNSRLFSHIAILPANVALVTLRDFMISRYNPFVFVILVDNAFDNFRTTFCTIAFDNVKHSTAMFLSVQRSNAIFLASVMGTCMT